MDSFAYRGKKCSAIRQDRLASQHQINFLKIIVASHQAVSTIVQFECEPSGILSGRLWSPLYLAPSWHLVQFLQVLHLHEYRFSSHLSISYNRFWLLDWWNFCFDYLIFIARVDGPIIQGPKTSNETVVAGQDAVFKCEVNPEEHRSSTIRVSCLFFFAFAFVFKYVFACSHVITDVCLSLIWTLRTHRAAGTALRDLQPPWCCL